MTQKPRDLGEVQRDNIAVMLCRVIHKAGDSISLELKSNAIDLMKRMGCHPKVVKRLIFKE